MVFKMQADAELVWQQERSNLETAAQTAQRRLQDLERVNAELQVHLDSQARAAAGQAPEKGAPPLPVLSRHKMSLSVPTICNNCKREVP